MYPTREELNRAADEIISSLSEEDQVLLLNWVRIPNIPDCQPEVLAMTMKFGSRLDPIIAALQDARERLHVNIDTLNLVILTRMPPRE